MHTARFIINKLMPLWLVVFGIVAYIMPTAFTVLTPYATYMLGGVIMLMSLTLTLGSLGEVFARPKAVISGFVIKWITVPWAAVIAATGRTLAAWQDAKSGGIGDAVRLVATILLPEREWLLARCDARLAAMFDDGAVEEVARLLRRDDIPLAAPIRRAIGVSEIAAMLDGTMTRDAALAAARIATRQYAKRQYTWFRNQPPMSWLRTAESEKDSIARQIEIRLRS